MSVSKHLQATVRITGMSCASCELALERKLKKVAGVIDVHADHRAGNITFTAHADALPSGDEIEAVIQRAGYGVSAEPSVPRSSGRPARKPPAQRKKKQLASPTSPAGGSTVWLEVAGSLLIIAAMYKLLQAFDFMKLAPAVPGAASFGGIVLVGLVAGASSCLAVTGGLLLALAAKHNELYQAETTWQKSRPLVYFNVGRLISYFVLGGVIGTIGKTVALSPSTSGVLNIVVAVVMFWLALSILQIIPKGSFPIRPPRKLAHWIAALSESGHPLAPLSLGALTFFLPCGFTQSLQLVALASGSFFDGALTMFAFALGTLPSLAGLSAVSAIARGTFSRLFLRFSGALVLLLAVFNLHSGLLLNGIDLTRLLHSPSQTAGVVPGIQGGIQEVSMSVTRSGYVPSQLTIRAGVPVRWIVDGSGATGCTSVLTIPSLNISRPLTPGKNVIEFTAQARGQLAFMCSMGMVKGAFTVI